MNSNYVYVPVEDGEYLHDDPNGPITINDNGNESVGRLRITIPDGVLKMDNMAICRRESIVWLDAPDGPGQWAFEGYIDYGEGDISDIQRYIYTVSDITGELTAFSDISSKKVKHMFGKWLRLNISWPSGKR